MARGQQLAQRTEQSRHILEMQAGRGFVEQEQLAGDRTLAGGLGQMTGELQALRLATRERRHGLAEFQILEADLRQRRQTRCQFAGIGEERQRFGHRHVEHVGNAGSAAVGAAATDLQGFVAIAASVAVGTAQVDVGQELHLDVFETVAAAGRAAAGAGVEAEGPGRVLAFPRGVERGESLADHVEGADVAGRIRACRAADRRLVDHHDRADQLGAFERGEGPRRFAGFALGLAQRRVQHVLNQRGFPGARYAGDAHQPLQRNLHVDMPQVVLGRTA